MLARTYRAFCLDSEGRITHTQAPNAADDAEAIAQAQALPKDAVSCEVWNVDRFVATFDGKNGGAIQRP